MKNIVEIIARSLVDYPEQVIVEEKQDGSHLILQLHVAPEDMGKVIGKQGRIAKAMRSVVKSVAIHENKKVSVEIV